ncbi:hypothetical protein VPH35_050104 [Triticum aestivum]|uniref:Cytochrome c oxidase subunit 5C n=3 Tax=Triticum TaxID=4564 RepID=A0A9R1Q8M9_TRITD|nr:cytochrome c oxidase subunit 5C-like [Triticum aestivum]CDM81134.1 unnamed protein product [Triticum aestivum]VAH72945.1 unnamed protein product [Triticum turgidum subsp. durum]
MSTTVHKVATHAASAAGARMKGRRPPSVVREIVYGMSLGLFAGYLWKLHHWSNQRRTREFHSLLDQGRISVVVDEPAGARTSIIHIVSPAYPLGEVFSVRASTDQ